MPDELAQQAGADSLPLACVLDQYSQLGDVADGSAAACQGHDAGGRGCDQCGVYSVPRQGFGEVGLPQRTEAVPAVTASPGGGCMPLSSLLLTAVLSTGGGYSSMAPPTARR